MEEGLVDASLVAGVLSPKGKASPQEEPLYKIRAAAEAFRDMRAEIAQTLQVRRFSHWYVAQILRKKTDVHWMIRLSLIVEILR